MALDMLHGNVPKTQLLIHGTDASQASLLAEAATLALKGRIFRGANGDIVWIAPRAGEFGLDKVKDDGGFDLMSLPTPQVSEAHLSDAECKVWLGDGVQCWARIEIPTPDENVRVV
ncbi:hypothetical protein [Rhodoblastus sp.]|uniref:hypothetical protein n=1 Tax=Rhodoblastus sp. TaxID=1962975 RepID=UPI003F97E371